MTDETALKVAGTEDLIMINDFADFIRNPDDKKRAYVERRILQRESKRQRS